MKENSIEKSTSKSINKPPMNPKKELFEERADSLKKVQKNYEKCDVSPQKTPLPKQNQSLYRENTNKGFYDESLFDLIDGLDYY